MKKETLKKCLMLILGISMFAATAEADNAKSQLIWSGCCVAVMGSSAAVLLHIEKKEE